MALHRNNSELLLWEAFWSSELWVLSLWIVKSLWEGYVHIHKKICAIWVTGVFLSLNSCSARGIERVCEKGGTVSPIVKKLYIRTAINKSLIIFFSPFKHRKQKRGCKWAWSEREKEGAGERREENRRRCKRRVKMCTASSCQRDQHRKRQPLPHAVLSHWGEEWCFKE